MLLELYVRDLALAEEVRLTLGPGLTVLTGETGAGKSLVVGALTWLLGARADPDMIRSGADAAYVEGIFDLTGVDGAARYVTEMGLDGEPDEAVISREVSRQGRGRCRINGRTVPLTQLREFAPLLLDVCGQHENQSLFRPGKQLAVLDRLGGSELWLTRQGLAASWSRLQALLSEQAQLELDSRQMAREQDLLQHQLAEIRGSGVDAFDEDALRAERQVLCSTDRLLTESTRVYEALAGGGTADACLVDDLADASHTLQALSRIDQATEPLSTSLLTALESLREVARGLRRYATGLEHDPERLEHVEQALDTLARLKRKYGETVGEIAQFASAAEQRLTRLRGSGERLAELGREISEATAVYLHACHVASRLRTECAARVSKEVAAELPSLGMPSAVFTVEITTPKEYGADVPTDASSTGCDQAEFVFTANAGEETRPLSKVASGGELSRVLLAIKHMSGRFDDMPTMVFDEIDAGIGGMTASSVGRKLAEIGLDRQVICVTHLPQIASMAGGHYAISKETEQGRTRAVVTRLEGDPRLHELARMLGSEATGIGIDHAREMLDRAAPLRGGVMHGGVQQND